MSRLFAWQTSLTQWTKALKMERIKINQTNYVSIYYRTAPKANSSFVADSNSENNWLRMVGKKLIIHRVSTRVRFYTAKMSFKSLKNHYLNKTNKITRKNKTNDQKPFTWLSSRLASFIVEALLVGGTESSTGDAFKKAKVLKLITHHSLRLTSKASKNVRSEISFVRDKTENNWVNTRIVPKKKKKQKKKQCSTKIPFSIKNMQRLAALNRFHWHLLSSYLGCWRRTKVRVLLIVDSIGKKFANANLLSSQ